MNTLKLSDYQLEITRRALNQIINDDINIGDLTIRELSAMQRVLAKITQHERLEG